MAVIKQLERDPKEVPGALEILRSCLKRFELAKQRTILRYFTYDCMYSIRIILRIRLRWLLEASDCIQSCQENRQRPDWTQSGFPHFTWAQMRWSDIITGLRTPINMYMAIIDTICEGTNTDELPDIGIWNNESKFDMN